jgi:hypothetical protein
VLPGSTPPHLARLPTDDVRITTGALATMTVHAARTRAVAGRPDVPRLAGHHLASGRHRGQAGQAKAEPAMGSRVKHAASPDGP